MNTKHWPSVAGLTLLAGIWAGCSEPINDVGFESWSPELAAPLLDTRFTLRDALAGTDFAGRVTEDANSALRIRTTNQLFEVSAGDALDIPGFAVPLSDVSTTFDFDDVGIDLPVTRIDLTTAKLYFQFRNDYPQAAQVLVQTSNFLVAGAGVNQVLTVPANSTVQDSVAVDAVSFRASPGNQITVTYDADLLGGPQDVRLTGGFFAVRAQDFSYAEGKFEGLELDFGLDSVALDLFSEFEPGSVKLVNPVATLTIENSVGAPVSVRTTDAFVRLQNGQRRDLISELTEGITLSYPRLGEGPVVKRTELVFDPETSNIQSLINEFPSAVAVGLNGVVNPENRDEVFSLHREAFVRGTLDVDVPLAMEFDGFEVKKDFPLDGSSLAEAESLSFLLRVDNGFNLDAFAQVEFYDAAGVSLGNLFTVPEQVLAAASTNVNGQTTASTARTIEVEVSPQQVRVITEARSAQVVLRLETPVNSSSSAPFTQLYYDSAIGVKLGTKVTLKPR